jgi:hypothetical protein
MKFLHFERASLYGVIAIGAAAGIKSISKFDLSLRGKSGKVFWKYIGEVAPFRYVFDLFDFLVLIYNVSQEGRTFLL